MRLPAVLPALASRLLSRPGGVAALALAAGAAQCAPSTKWRPPPSALIAVAPAAALLPGGPAPDEPTFDLEALTAVLDEPSLAEAKARLSSSPLDAARLASRVLEALQKGTEARARFAFQVGELRMLAGDPLGAARAFDEASAPHSQGGAYALAPHARLLAARLLLESGKPKDAAERLRLVVGAPEPIASENEARALLAEALDGAGAFDEGKKLWAEHLALEDREGRDASAARIRFAKALLRHPSEENGSLAVRELRKVRGKAALDEAHQLEAKALLTLPSARRTELGAPGEQDTLSRARALIQPKRAREGLKLVEPLVKAKAPPIACDAGRVKADLLGALGRKGEAADALEVALPSCRGGDAEPAALFASGKALAAVGRFELAEKRFGELEASFAAHRLADDARFHGARASLGRGDAARYERQILAMPDAYPTGDLVLDALFDLALRHMSTGAWREAKAALARGSALPQRERSAHASGRFRYYLGRALLETGDVEGGKRELGRVVTDHPLSLYMGLAYARLSDLAPEAARAALDAARARDRVAKLVIKRVPEMASVGFVRAVELARQGEAKLSRAEFDALGVGKKTAPREIGYVAAILLGRAGPKEARAILRAPALSPVEPVDWLDHYPEGSWRTAWEISFPRPWLDVVQKEATRSRIPEALAYAIMREESAFEPRAVSSKKAYGLMQLIVPTARAMAKPLNLPADPESLKRPEVNVALGCQFLSKARGMFPANPLLAVPGYNAGPGAPKKWIGARGAEDMDLWIEHIPYEETLVYTKRVLSSILAYDALYGDLPGSEALRLPKHAAGKGS